MNTKLNNIVAKVQKVLCHEQKELYDLPEHLN